MLVFQRKQATIISLPTGEIIKITMMHNEKERAPAIGIDAPRHIAVDREEVFKEERKRTLKSRRSNEGKNGWKRASRLLIIKFEIEDPDKLDNEKPRNAKVSHRNPVLRLDAGRMWDTIKHTAVFKPMFWGKNNLFSGENGIEVTITPIYT